MKRTWILVALIVAVAVLGFTSQNAIAQSAVTGIVVDQDGNPIAGARVVIQSAVVQRGERPFAQRFETGDDGIFGWRGVPAGRYMLTVAARQYLPTRQEVGVRQGQVVRTRVVLQARENRERPERETGSILGQVTDVNGNPVEGAVVTVVIQRRERLAPRHVGVRAVTNARGVFQFDAVPVGNWLITARTRTAGARDAIEVTANEETRVDLQLQERGGR